MVWDVDPVARTIAAYHAHSPLQPTVFSPGQTATADPAVPGWKVAVDAVFASSS